jgi:uncharacterized cupredoxin-like copper-binding protein
MGLLIACGMMLAACAADDGFVEPTSERMEELKAAVAAVDWSKSEEIDLVLGEFRFRPAELTFRRNQPYELSLVNEGAVPHSFVAPAFFDAVAVQGLVFADGEVSMPLLQSVAVESGETKILIFVPLEAGEFSLICDQPLHKTFGMEGIIRIE